MHKAFYKNVTNILLNPVPTVYCACSACLSRHSFICFSILFFVLFVIYLILRIDDSVCHLLSLHNKFPLFNIDQNKLKLNSKTLRAVGCE